MTAIKDFLKQFFPKNVLEKLLTWFKHQKNVKTAKLDAKECLGKRKSLSHSKLYYRALFTKNFGKCSFSMQNAYSAKTGIHFFVILDAQIAVSIIFLLILVY